MNEIGIIRLKRRFIMVAMGSLVLTMLLMSFLLYAGNAYLNRQSIYNTLDYIVENNGELTAWAEHQEDSYSDIFLINRNYRSSEFPHNTRYFVIYYDGEKNVTSVLTSHIEAVDEEEAYEYGQRAISKRRKYGRVDEYYYKLQFEDGVGGLVVYLDGTDVINSNLRLFYLALMINGFGIVLAFFIVRACAKGAVQPEIRNAEIQKRFMTDASHELKTPLSVIRANAEMQEIMEGETEWTKSTLRQVERMTKLIQNLVLIARAEEKSTHEEAHVVDVSLAVTETAENLRAVAISEGKDMLLEVDEGVTMLAEEAQIRQLCSLLTDNAIKYCDEGGTVGIKLKQRGKGFVLTVSNPYAEGANVDYRRFFDRFYREDQSHNIDKGGYGIGLSVAEAICKQYHGNIRAEWSKGDISFIASLKCV